MRNNRNETLGSRVRIITRKCYNSRMGQVLVNLVGYPGSGKRTIMAELAKAYGLNIVDGDRIRALLNDMVSYYKDPEEQGTPINDSFRSVVDGWRVTLVRELLMQGQSVIVRGGIDAESRKKYRDVVRAEFANVPIVMIHCQVDETKLLERLKARGADWVERYHDYFSQAVQPPQDGEYDELIVYTQDNSSEVVQRLGTIINNTL